MVKYNKPVAEAVEFLANSIVLSSTEVPEVTGCSRDGACEEKVELD